MSTPAGLGWLAILRLGLVQSALGSIVVLTTSTLNRVMVVELALPAILPGVLVGLHYGVQIARPRFGYGSDRSPRRSIWIVGGMGALALGAVAATASVWLMQSRPAIGMAAAALAFVVIGGGVGASGTALLALMARKVAPARRGAAAAVVWLMMIVGIIVTSAIAGALLEPFSLARLLAVATGVSAIAWLMSVVAVIGVEGRANATRAPAEPPAGHFRDALAAAWADSRARLFTIFVFVSMLAYSMQDLILEPFAGRVFGLSPGQSTQLTGVQNGGVLAGMIAVGALSSGMVLARRGSLRVWAAGGCVASAVALVALVGAAWSGPPWPIQPTVFVLGLANGGFAVAAIALMMSLAGAGDGGDGTGTRVGLWGAAQAMAFGLGGLLGTSGVDLLGQWLSRPSLAYGAVFGFQALLFLAAGGLMLRIDTTEIDGSPAESRPVQRPARPGAGQ